MTTWYDRKEKNPKNIKMLWTCIIQGGGTTEPKQVWSTADLHHIAYIKNSHRQMLTKKLSKADQDTAHSGP